MILALSYLKYIVNALLKSGTKVILKDLLGNVTATIINNL
ncbi:translation initiation factor IF-2 [Croceibacter atlanticus HTCC2559]|jgi:hypothetical protein|uniref:Translation initiation factor IF-2 n=1 Tax=Croceibacter atlanticus (strain ATCC BAA-628 / JCM 21780 / CIP 108009 / IAM 15332 / KCTC 12090 / HTCC2559) TaxID=216432 RepID=A3U536_CROAH|nr:translation initiation factor IF-2 [Croceibacter atlanticus HTCC2559]|tara:strand:+ start:592 stop:711 length:120 start_codon:yes stop_codon:yes gene_type:complete